MLGPHRWRKAGYQSIIDKRLILPDHDELRTDASAAIAKHSRRGWRIDKASRSDNVDAIVSLMMALDSFGNQAEPAQLLGWL